jgi:hypothetical protein
MLHAALVLAAAIGTGSPGATPAVQSLLQPRTAGVCGPGIDPLFVRHVDPPTRRDGRNPLLWLIGGGSQASAPQDATESGECLRPLQVRDGR